MNVQAAVFCGWIFFLSGPVHSQEMLVDPDPKGYASGVYGQVMVLEPEAAAPRALADSEPVFEGSRITAGENSFAEIDLLDGSEVKVDEMTQVDLSKVSAEPESLERNIDLSMLYGALRISAQEGFSDRSVFKITTPVSVAGVRGTDFAVEYESEDESHVDVFDGEVGVGADGSVESVGTGESARQAKGRGIAKSGLPEDRRQRWDQFQGAMDLHGQDNAQERLREKIARVREANPADPRLAGLENALQNVSKQREEVKSRFEASREKIKDRRAERLARMREFAKTHGRERFEQARKFRGGALTPEERNAAAEKIRDRRQQAREKAGERFKERKREREERRKENLQDRRENRKDQFQEKKENRRERIQDRREQKRDNAPGKRGDRRRR